MDPTVEMGVDEADLAQLRVQTRRERMAQFFRTHWIPVVLAFAGFSAGTTAMMVYNRMNSYPYATAVVAAVASSGPRDSKIRRLLLLSIPLATVGFILGLKTGDIILPQNRLPAGAMYGVAHTEERQSPGLSVEGPGSRRISPGPSGPVDM